MAHTTPPPEDVTRCPWHAYAPDHPVHIGRSATGDAVVVPARIACGRWHTEHSAPGPLDHAEHAIAAATAAAREPGVDVDAARSILADMARRDADDFTDRVHAMIVCAAPSLRDRIMRTPRAGAGGDTPLAPWWATLIPGARCVARRDAVGSDPGDPARMFHGRCALRPHGIDIDHAVERAGQVARWSTMCHDLYALAP